jgi:hypothetical protein
MSPDYRLTVLAAGLATQHNFPVLFLAVRTILATKIPKNFAAS